MFFGNISMTPPLIMHIWPAGFGITQSFFWPCCSHVFFCDAFYDDILCLYCYPLPSANSRASDSVHSWRGDLRLPEDHLQADRNANRVILDGRETANKMKLTRKLNIFCWLTQISTFIQPTTSQTTDAAKEKFRLSRIRKDQVYFFWKGSSFLHYIQERLGIFRNVSVSNKKPAFGWSLTSFHLMHESFPL